MAYATVNPTPPIAVDGPWVKVKGPITQSTSEVVGNDVLTKGVTVREGTALETISACPQWSLSIWVDAYVQRRNLLGTSISYRFHQGVTVCYDGVNTTGVTYRNGYITNTDGLHQYKGLIGQYEVGLWSPVYTSFMQGEVDNCWGNVCGNTYYPWVKINVNGQGGYSFDGRA